MNDTCVGRYGRAMRLFDSGRRTRHFDWGWGVSRTFHLGTSLFRVGRCRGAINEGFAHFSSCLPGETAKSIPVMASFVSDYPTSSAAGAVFLSCAPEDTGVARRIAEALRGFGVEVWSDQGELRNSDAWDEKSAAKSARAPKRAAKAMAGANGSSLSGAPTTWSPACRSSFPSRLTTTPNRARSCRAKLSACNGRTGHTAGLRRNLSIRAKDLRSRPHQPVAGRPADPANFLSESDERLKKAESRFGCSVT